MSDEDKISIEDENNIDENDIMETIDENDSIKNIEEINIRKNKYDEMVTSHRMTDFVLPETVTLLEKPCGSKVYLIGTAHFSEDSIADVVRIMDQTIPDCVILELCVVRSKMLLMDDESLKSEMVKANLLELIKREGVLPGVMQYLMLRMSNHVMDQMKMLPGGEFRAAFRKAKELPFSHIALADRRIDITLKRALASLGLGGRLKFFSTLMLGLKPISKEDIESMKKADILEQIMKELGNEFPSLARVIVDERDLFLTKSIWDCVHPVDSEGKIPSINVAVVGIGHSSGIVKYWNQAADIDQMELCKIETPPLSWTLFLQSFRLSLFSIIGYISYKICYSVYNLSQSYINSSM